MNLNRALLLLPGLMVGLSLHEFAHAWSASLLGDNFARRQGRVSLNPLRHLAPLGTLAIFFLPIGWAKPVQVNLYNFKHPRRDYLLTSLAGPLANIVVVTCCFVLMHVTRHTYAFGPRGERVLGLAHELLLYTAIINAILATINLIPIPPLDGSKIWPYLLPGIKPVFGAKRMWIFLIVLIVLIQTGALRPTIEFTIRTAERIMPKADSFAYARFHNAGTAALQAEEYDRAERLLSEAITINPWADYSLYVRCNVRFELDNLQGALGDVNRAIKLDDRKPDYFNRRAMILEKLGRHADAAEDRKRYHALRRAMGITTRPASQPSSGPSPGRTAERE